MEDGEHQTIDLAAITCATHLSNEDQAVNDIHVYSKRTAKLESDDQIEQAKRIGKA